VRCLAFALLLLGALAAAPGALAQCAMCKAAVISSPEGMARAESLNRAILLMMAAPYATAGAAALVLFRHRIRARLGRALAAARAR
jgi:hypothetical protein